MLEKTVRMNNLYDFYHPLLTEKQQKYMSLYYRSDFSLSEIADEFNVSRQAVYDTIRRTEQIIEQYENKLQLFEKFKRRQQLIRQLFNKVSDGEHKETIITIIKNLEKLD